MDNETPFAAEIRKYEDVLAKDPRSFCFAPLSDVYRRAGMLDEALDVALKGCEMHPHYLGGYMALGRACFEKGLLPEGRKALEKVVKVMPDNLLAHNLLAEICRKVGDVGAAARSDAVIRSMTADESELMEVAAGGVEDLEHDDDVLELTEIFEMADELPVEEPEQVLADERPWEMEYTEEPSSVPTWELEETEEPVAAPSWEPEVAQEPVSAPISPISTATIAELYVSQGFTDRALGIYREMLAADPGNTDVQRRVSELSQTEEPEEQPAAHDTAHDLPHIVEAAAEGEGDRPGPEAVVAKLEGWLENIRRRR